MSWTCGGLRIHIAEAGTGPLVLLLHGFPECWYSWRHQLAALAAAGSAPWRRTSAATAAPAARPRPASTRCCT